MTAPGHKPRHRHEEWDYGSWEFAASDDVGRRLRARLLQRTLTERRMQKRQDSVFGSPSRVSMGDGVRRQQAAVDPVDSATPDGTIYLS